jgi:excisionase family DNA binding protein
LARAVAPHAVPPGASRWLTLGQACRVLGVDESTLRRWADGGQVRTFRTPGGHRRFAEADLQDLLAGRGRDSYRELGELTINRVRRRLHRSPGQDAEWYATVDEAGRERLRPLGRRLAALAAEYASRRPKKGALLEDARALGREYGKEAQASGLSLAQLVDAFIFFRRSLDDAAKQAILRRGLPSGDALAAYEQVVALADQALVGLVEAYGPAQ